MWAKKEKKEKNVLEATKVVVSDQGYRSKKRSETKKIKKKLLERTDEMAFSDGIKADHTPHCTWPRRFPGRWRLAGPTAVYIFCYIWFFLLIVFFYLIVIPFVHELGLTWTGRLRLIVRPLYVCLMFVCMYVCMYVCIYLYVWYVYIYMCVCVCIYIYVYVYIHTYILYVCIYIYIYIYIADDTYIHKCIYIYIYI